MKQIKMWADLEVTDFDPRIGGITQCSIIIEQDGKILDQQDFFINPNTYPNGVSINIYNLTRSHLTEMDIEKYPNQREAFDQMVRILKKYDCKLILAGHNVIKHDLRFLQEWFRENDEDIFDYITYNPLDTLSLAIIARDCGLLSDCKGNSLGDLCEYFNITQEKWHRASDDVQSVRNMYMAFIEYIKKNVNGI